MLTELLCVVVTAAALMTPAAKQELVKLELYPIEQHVVEFTNTERTQRGLPPLKIDMRLMRSARRHNSWMTKSGNFRHTTQPVGENIAMGQSDSKAAVNAWMNSSGHRANILNGRYTKIGVSAFRSKSGQIYWTQQFQN